ncbi:MAG: hypothetical protein ACRCZD_18190 [Phycicoccus sp.]
MPTSIVAVLVVTEVAYLLSTRLGPETGGATSRRAGRRRPSRWSRFAAAGRLRIAELVAAYHARNS